MGSELCVARSRHRQRKAPHVRFRRRGEPAAHRRPDCRSIPKTGAIDFTFPWRSRSYESVNAASPVVAGNQVFISASYRTGGALLNVLPDGKHCGRVDIAGDRHALEHGDPQGWLPLRLRRTKRTRRIAGVRRTQDRQSDVACNTRMGGDDHGATASQRTAADEHVSRHAARGRRRIPLPRRNGAPAVAGSLAERLQRDLPSVAVRGARDVVAAGR